MKLTNTTKEKENLKMAANVETMFSVREKPWHGLGKIVMEAPTSKDALRLAGLDWNVVLKLQKQEWDVRINSEGEDEQ